jgi:hypothetical protein
MDVIILLVSKFECSVRLATIFPACMCFRNSFTDVDISFTIFSLVGMTLRFLLYWSRLRAGVAFGLGSGKYWMRWVMAGSSPSLWWWGANLKR